MAGQPAATLVVIVPLLTVIKCPIEEPGELCFAEDLELAGPVDGDGVADLALIIETVASEPPDELHVGAIVRIEGSYWWALLCGDDDLACPDSFVVRDEYGRFVVGMFQTNSPSPYPDDALFDALGRTPAAWSAPFEFEVVDELPCDLVIGPCDGQKRRLRVDVEVGECKTASFIDEAAGHVAERFFVSVDEAERWVPANYCVDQIDATRIYIARQDCPGAGSCPTHASAECPPDGHAAKDRAYVEFEHEPAALAYSYTCEILGVDEDAGTHEYTLDCGDLG